ncbi:hypothetical protein EIP91_010101 [Steccherinum ochraceum]|uniref:Uncharacterized protein n=1 Tax=Steccherinum ochraceum TaxID=92696 RepID=A0A4R0RWV8_9APHY|nr:hypothetical protein EIP91_010101 [Steccherinum ochraceum]
MMPPSIVSEAYYTTRDAPLSPQTEPLEAVIHFRHPTLLDIKDDLHDEIARIFADTAKPSLPPFTLPSGTLFDSPTSTNSGLFTFTRTSGSDTASVSSRGSSFRTNSTDSLLFSPNTPSHSVDLYGNPYYNAHAPGSIPYVGLGFNGLCKQDGTPFDGFGMLQPVVYSQESVPPSIEQAYPYASYGLGFYGEDTDCAQCGGEREVLFDIDGDTTLVDLKGLVNGRRETRSANLPSRQSSFSPPGLSNESISDLDHLFSSLTTQPSSLYPRGRRPSYKVFAHSRVRKPLSVVLPSDYHRRSTSPSPQKMGRRGLLHTVPLPPSTADVFYEAPTPALNAPPPTPAPSPAARPSRFRAARFFQLRKDEEDLPSWTLPPVSMEPKQKKARL